MTGGIRINTVAFLCVLVAAQSGGGPGSLRAEGEVSAARSPGDLRQVVASVQAADEQNKKALQLGMKDEEGLLDDNINNFFAGIDQRKTLEEGVLNDLDQKMQAKKPAINALLKGTEPKALNEEFDKYMGDLDTTSKEQHAAFNTEYEKQETRTRQGAIKLESSGHDIEDFYQDTQDITEKTFSETSKRIGKSKLTLIKEQATDKKWWKQEENAESEIAGKLRAEARATYDSMRALSEAATKNLNYVKKMYDRMKGWVEALAQNNRQSIGQMLPLKLLKERHSMRRGLTAQLARGDSKASREWSALQRVIDNVAKDSSKKALRGEADFSTVMERNDVALDRQHRGSDQTLTKTNGYRADAAENLREVETAFKLDHKGYSDNVQEVKNKLAETVNDLNAVLLQPSSTVGGGGQLSKAAKEELDSHRALLEKVLMKKQKGLSNIDASEKQIQTDYTLLHSSAQQFLGLKDSYKRRGASALTAWESKKTAFQTELDQLRTHVASVTNRLGDWRKATEEAVQQTKEDMADRTATMQSDFENMLDAMDGKDRELPALAQEHVDELKARIRGMMDKMEAAEAARISTSEAKTHEIEELSKTYTVAVTELLTWARALGSQATVLQNQEMAKLLVAVGDAAGKADRELTTTNDVVRRTIKQLSTRAEEAVTSASITFSERSQAMVTKLGGSLRTQGRDILKDGAGWIETVKTKGGKMVSESDKLRQSAAALNASAHEQERAIVDAEAGVHKAIDAGKLPLTIGVVGGASPRQFSDAYAKVRDGIRGVVADISSSALQQIDEETTTVKDSALKGGSTVSSGVAKQSAQTILDASGDFDKLESTVSDKLADVVGFVAGMQGKAKNETEWFERVQSRMRSAETDAANLAVAEADSSLHQQAAIDAKFAALNKVINEDVHNIDKDQQAMIASLSAAAKKQAELAVHGGQLSGEALRLRLQKIDQWLSTQVSDVMQQTEAAGVNLDTNANATRNFDAETVDRLADLESMVEADNRAAGIETDTNQAKETGLGLGEILTSGNRNALQIRSELAKLIAQRSRDHRFEGKKVLIKIGSDHAILEDVLQRADLAMAEAIASGEKDSVADPNAIYKAQAAMETALRQFELMGANMAKRLHEMPGDRQKLLDTVDDTLLTGRESFQRLEKDMIERMELWSQVSDEFFAKQQGHHEEWQKRFESVMGSEQMDVLSRVGAVHVAADALLAKTDERWEDKQKWLASNSKWEVDVEKVFKSLVNGLDEEIHEASDSANSFSKDLDSDANEAEKAEDGKINRDMADMNQGIGDFGATSANSWMKNLVSANGGADGTDAAADSVAASMGPLDESSKLEQSKINAAKAGFDQSRGKFGQAEGTERQLTAASVAKANADKAAVMEKINGMTSKMSSLADLSTDDALVSSVALTLGENGRLAAKHAELAQRIASLRANNA